MKLTRSRAVLAALLACMLGLFIVPAATFADEISDELQEQVNEAYSILQSYSAELELATNELYAIEEELAVIQEEIAATEEEIAATEEELAECQAELASQLSASYMQGNGSLLALVLGATDFQDLFVRIFYANKIAEYETQVLENVKALQAELEEEKTALEAQEAEQEELLATQEATVEEISAQVAEQQSYYDALDAELQEALANEAAIAAAEEAAAKAAEEAAAEAAAAAAEEAATATNDDDSSSTSSDDSSSDDTTSSSSSLSETLSTNTDSGNAPSSVVDYALTKVGCSYVYGASGPSSFDCSGLAMWSYAQVGISLPHNSQAQYNVVKNLGHLVYSVEYLSPGDLVFWGTGGSGSAIYHVGIYIGNGQYVHASNYGVGVIISTLSTSGNFAGGGSPV